MMIVAKPIREQKILYHLTALDNLPSIVENGLCSRQLLDTFGIGFLDTANHDILVERERLELSNFIPFHFHTHTAYDTAVKNRHTDVAFIYLCITKKYARINNFPILPIHPTSKQKPELYSFDEGIAKIDWDTMEQNKENYFGDESYRTQVRMAECLSPRRIPISDISCIFVKDDIIEYNVNMILNSYGEQCDVFINPKFF